ncbi:SAM-dependent methyltransferase [Sinanaerobacter chloroacetimidivorans]|jgi:cyclopropane fatty-acyl-phospholipid synthase-like methyltransferase|uniref:Methyltransferase domain-containing protein n=1 Tax=Sinanaerobacter chloroacetimidivorans TaxID=2818044 RepID=A0A8J7W5D9_9FIRM|nr:methyltransferase domain-containing protein [Sinanaerobacter chloroacetimidivorans]MBR0599356.1 methyltransferase domain-containing protein [Sinanaerobacter chloroacetimidivorans]
MNYIKSKKYEDHFIKENIMGPNPIKLLEELLEIHPIPQSAIVLDLGCGRGVTSIFLVKEYGLRVFATDLWISATDNQKRFEAMGLTSEQIIPIHADAHALPYSEEFFDAVVSIDSYHYFGCKEEYLGKHLLPLVKQGGYLLFVVPGLKKDIHDNIPHEMLLSWTPDDIETLHDAAYWKRILEATDGIEILSVFEMEGFDECWNDWLLCENEYAISDRKSMNAGAGNYMNFVAMIIRRKEIDRSV